MAGQAATLACRRLLVVVLAGLFVLAASACNAADSQDEAPRMLLQSAADALKGEKFEEAIRLAKKASQAAPKDALVQQRSAEVLFLAGDVAASLPCFDRANQLDESLAPHNWQRGVALGCAGKFSEGADQFRLHHEVNPDDVENSAWYFLCVAKTKGKAAAEAALIPSRGDRRQPMMSVLKMLQGTLTPNEVLAAAEANTKDGPDRKLAMFYGFLYVGLYYDSIGESEKARSALDRSVALAEKDYMGRTAQIYREHRFAKTPPTSPQPPSTTK
jgi:lipoprotein NlpI